MERDHESRQDGTATGMLLCSSCYQRLISREAARMVALPGVIEPDRMVRLQTATRKCNLCSLMPAVWSDPDSKTHLCDACYQREVERGSAERSKTCNSPP